MTEAELREKFVLKTPVFEAWGREVIKLISSELTANEEYEILKMTPTHRVKEVEKFIIKAFYRKKNYLDPFNDITDKVGCRFVVLLLNKIDCIEKVINKIDIWSASKDRDFEDERKRHPELFIYQSVHYVVRNKHPFKVGEIEIPENTSCEIQIRTLLQHAYSELTHDSIYKNTFAATSNIKRLAARSIALIETADNIFLDVMKELNLISEQREKYMRGLREYYNQFIQTEYAPEINYEVLESFNDRISVQPEEIIKFINENHHLTEIIIEKSKTNFIYSQPIILYLFYIINKWNFLANKYWPLSSKYLELISLDSGYSIST